MFTINGMNMMNRIQNSKKINGRDLNLFLILYQDSVKVKICAAQIVVHQSESEKIVVTVFIRAEGA